MSLVHISIAFLTSVSDFHLARLHNHFPVHIYTESRYHYHIDVVKVIQHQLESSGIKIYGPSANENPCFCPRF